MNEQETPKRPIKSVSKAFGIIEEVQEKDGAGVTELADSLDLAPSTVHDHLSTLMQNGYIVKEGDEYQIGLKHLYHGIYAKHRFEQTNARIYPVIKQLADITGEVVWFVTEEQGYAIYLERAEGEHSIASPSMLGMRRRMHSIASGKAILSHLPEERRRHIIESTELDAKTEHTITDAETLMEQLERIRDRGYAFNKEEMVMGVRAVAAPVLVDDMVRGAVGVSGPSNRMRGQYFEDELPNRVLASVNELELEIMHS